MPSRLWSFRNGSQLPITIILTDEQALKRLLSLKPNQELVPCEGAAELRARIEKELATA
jgi:hypothetical protein